MPRALSQPPAHRQPQKPTQTPPKPPQSTNRPMPSSSSSPSPSTSTRARNLFCDFARTLKKPRADMESKALKLGPAHSAGVQKFREDYFNDVRARWQVKLQEAGLRMDEWVEVTKEDEVMIGDVLGAGEGEGNSVQPQPQPQPHQTQPPPPPPPPPQPFHPYLSVPQVAPSFSASTRSTNFSSSSYAFVDPGEFNSDDDNLEYPYFQPVATSHDLTSDDDDAPPAPPVGPSRHRSYTQTQANQPQSRPVPMTSTRARAATNGGSGNHSLASSFDSSSGLFGYGFAQEDHRAQSANPYIPSNFHKNGATSASQHALNPSSSNPPSPPSNQTNPSQRHPYIGPSLSDPSEPIDEEQSFERYKMLTRMQKIIEFHEAAAIADVRLAMRIWLARKAYADGAQEDEEEDPRWKEKEKGQGREKRRPKHDDAPMVEEHQQRMMQLQMEKEEERKSIVKAERSKRRAALSISAHATASSSSVANGKRPSHNPPAWTQDIETQMNALVKDKLGDMNRLLADEQGLFGDESGSASMINSMTNGLGQGWTNGSEHEEANDEEDEEEEAEEETGQDSHDLRQKQLEEEFFRTRPHLRHLKEGGVGVGVPSGSGSTQPQPQLQTLPKQMATTSKAGQHPGQMQTNANGTHNRRMSTSTPTVPVSASASASSQAQGKGKAKAQPQPLSQSQFHARSQFQTQAKAGQPVHKSLFGEDSDEEVEEAEDVEEDEEQEEEEDDAKTPAMPFFNGVSQAHAQGQGQGQNYNPYFQGSTSTSSNTWSDDLAAQQAFNAWKMARGTTPAPPATFPVPAPAIMVPPWGNGGGNVNINANANANASMAGVRPGTASGWSVKGDRAAATPVNGNAGGGGMFGLWGKKTTNNNNDMAAAHPFGLDEGQSQGIPAPVPPIPMQAPASSPATPSTGLFGFTLGKGKKNQQQVQNQNQSTSSPPMANAEVSNKKPSPPLPAQSKGKAVASPTVPSPPAPAAVTVSPKITNGNGPGKGGREGGKSTPAPAPVPPAPQNMKKMNKKQKQALLKKGGGAALAAQAAVEPEPASQAELGQEQEQEQGGEQEGEQESVSEPGMSVANPAFSQFQPQPPIQHAELPGFDLNADADVLAAMAEFVRVPSQNQNQNQFHSSLVHPTLPSTLNHNLTPTGGAIAGGFNWDEVASTPRPPPKVPRFQQQFQQESMGVGMGGGMGMGVQPETPRPGPSWFGLGGGAAKNNQMQMGADGFGMLAGRGGQAQDATIRQSQRGSGGANASVRSVWGGQQQQPQVMEPQGQGQMQEVWVPGGFRSDDAAGVNGVGGAGAGMGMGGGGGFEDGGGGGGMQFWQPSVSRSPPVEQAPSSSVPASGRGQPASLAAHLLRRNAEPSSSFSNNQASDLQSTQSAATSSPLNHNNSISKKARGKKAARGKRVTVEEVADPDEEEEAKRDALPSNSRSILESKIVEPKPSVPAHLFNSIIGYEDGDGEEEDSNNSSSASHSMAHSPSTAPGLTPDDMLHQYPDDARIAAGIRQMQEATMKRGAGGVNGPQAYVQPQHARWTPPAAAAAPSTPAAPPFASASGSGSLWSTQSQAKVLKGKSKLDPASMTNANDVPTPKMANPTVQARRGKLAAGAKSP